MYTNLSESQLSNYHSQVKLDYRFHKLVSQKNNFFPGPFLSPGFPMLGLTSGEIPRRRLVETHSGVVPTPNILLRFAVYLTKRNKDVKGFAPLDGEIRAVKSARKNPHWMS